MHKNRMQWVPYTHLSDLRVNVLFSHFHYKNEDGIDKRIKYTRL